MNLVFMGTPSFAAVSLETLIKSDHTVMGAFCNPDKGVGRKNILTPPAVKTMAQKYNIPVYQPKTLNDEQSITALKEIKPDLIVVVAYGKFLPKKILSLPKKGCINLHGSLLPKYRGAAPIQRSVLNGDKSTGLTTIYLSEKMDAGDIIDRVKVEIEQDETSKGLFEKMASVGAKLLLKTINDIETGTAQTTPQDKTQVTYAPALTKEEALINFNEKGQEVHNKIRGYYDWPKGYVYYKEKKLTLLKSEFLKLEGEPGEILSNDKLVVGCKEGAIELLKVQLEGKKEITGKEFLNGQRLKKYDKIK